MATYYYYVAGNGNGSWGNNQGVWYYGSGGTGGLSPVPTSSDIVIFDAASGSGICTVAATRSCYNLIMTGFTGRITGGGTAIIQVWGTTITLSSSGIFDPTNSPALHIYSGTTTNLTTNGQTVGHISIFNNSTLVLQDDLITHNNQILTLSYGTFNANNKNVTIGIFTDGGSTNPKTLTMGTGVWTVLQSGPLNLPENVWYVQQPSFITITPGSYTSPGSTCLTGFLSGSPGYPSLPFTYSNNSKLRFVRARDSTGLASAVSLTSTTITLVDTVLDTAGTLWPSTGTVLIDDEMISYTSLTGSAFANNIVLGGLTRGINGTTIAAHAAGRAVLLYGPPITNLTAAVVSGSDTTITVADTTNFPGDGFILIDGEVIQYSSKTATTFAVAARGTAYGGSAVGHDNGSVVRLCEARNIYFGANKSYNTVEFGTNGAYIWSYIKSGGSVLTMQNTNYGIQYIRFDALPAITDFRLAGSINQPVYVYGFTGTAGFLQFY